MLQLHDIMRNIIPKYLKGGMKQDKLNKPPTISIKHDHTYYSLEEYEKMEDTKQQLLNDERYFGTDIELDILRRDGKDFELIIVARGSLADAEQNIRERQEEKEQKELDSGLIDDEERDEYNKDNIQMIKDRRFERRCESSLLESQFIQEKEMVGLVIKGKMLTFDKNPLNGTYLVVRPSYEINCFELVNFGQMYKIKEKFDVMRNDLKPIDAMDPWIVHYDEIINLKKIERLSYREMMKLTNRFRFDLKTIPMEIQLN